MKAGKWHGGKGSSDRVTDKDSFDNNFENALPNAFVPSWKRRQLEEQAAKAQQDETEQAPSE